MADEVQAQRPRRKHSSEFKAQVIQDCGQAGVSIRSIAQLHNVDPSLVRHWLAVHRAQAGTVRAAAERKIVKHAEPVSRKWTYAQCPHIRYNACMNSLASTVINLRTPASQRELIDRAAQLQGKSRTEFMLEASREKAQQVLLDQTLFTVTPKQYKAFVALMDAPLSKNVALQRLLAKRSPWEK